MTVYFDMDGTIANFYGVDGWLNMLESYDPTPYAIAEPLLDMMRLQEMLLEIQDRGIEVGIISWLSKSGTPEFNRKVSKAKKAWLAKYLPEVDFNELHILKYGVPKQEICWDDGILFDDEERNRTSWNGKAYDEKNIFDILTQILEG